jgi:hypothetical protein
MTAASDDVLAGLPRPLGDAAAVSSTGQRHSAAAQEVGGQARTLMGSMHAITTSLWSGQAASSAMGYALVLASVCAKIADTADETGTALRTYGTALADAQAQWDHAARLAEQAVADETAYRTRADHQAQDLVTQAAAHHESGVGAGHIADELRTDASSYQSPLRTQAVAIATQAIQAVRRAGQTATAQVQQATNIVAPPPPPTPKPHHTPWYDSVLHQVAGFGEGLYRGVLDPTKLLIGLVNPFGDQLKHWEQLGSGLATAFEHPGQFGKALIDWKDISTGQYGRWLGELAPSVAAAFATGGAAAAVKGVDGVTALERVGLTAADVDGLSTADATSVMMRGAKPVPGMIAKDGAPVLGKDLSFTGGPEAALAKYRGAFTSEPVREDNPLAAEPYFNAHDVNQSLLDHQRSLFWGSPIKDGLRASSEAQYRANLAVAKEFQPTLNEATIVMRPAGPAGTYFHGSAAEQLSRGSDLLGGGQQSLNPLVTSDKVIWSGPLPWEKVTDLGYAMHGAGQFAGAGGATRSLQTLLTPPGTP